MEESRAFIIVARKIAPPTVKRFQSNLPSFVTTAYELVEQ
jgi:hypothetical protein